MRALFIELFRVAYFLHNTYHLSSYRFVSACVDRNCGIKWKQMLQFTTCRIRHWNLALNYEIDKTALCLSTQVSPIIINTVITIQSALTPTAETPEELDSPVPVDLWEKQGWKHLKLWFLEEEGDEDTASLAPLIPQGESLQVFSCIVTQLIILYGWLHAII